MASTATRKKPSQPKAPTVHVSLGTFDTNHPMLRIVRTSKLAHFKRVGEIDYSPHGRTPLFDATAQFIAHLEEQRAKDRVVVGLLADESGSMIGNRKAVIEGFNDFIDGLREVEKVDPESAGQVLCVIFTDGMENASVEHTQASLSALIKDREADGWNFIFLGANMDSIEVGAGMGLSGTASGQTFNFTASPSGTRSAMNYATSTSNTFLTSNASYAALGGQGTIAENGAKWVKDDGDDDDLKVTS